jgi:hypothetical protein
MSRVSAASRTAFGRLVNVGIDMRARVLLGPARRPELESTTTVGPIGGVRPIARSHTRAEHFEVGLSSIFGEVRKSAPRLVRCAVG